LADGKVGWNVNVLTQHGIVEGGVNARAFITGAHQSMIDWLK